MRALERGTSVNSVVREFLEGYAGVTRETDALRAFGQLADQAQASSGPSGRTWARDGLYDRT